MRYLLVFESAIQSRLVVCSAPIDRAFVAVNVSISQTVDRGPLSARTHAKARLCKHVNSNHSSPASSAMPFISLAG